MFGFAKAVGAGIGTTDKAIGNATELEAPMEA